MIQSTLKKTLVVCTTVDGFIEVRSQYNATVQAWLIAIGFRFDGKSNSFRSRKTASAARLLVKGSPDCALLEISHEIRAMALIDEDQSIDFESQPELRNTNLWRHQVGAYSFASQRDASLWDMGMGTGKTLPAVCEIVNAGWRATLVLCPVAVLGVWRREVAKWAAKPVEVLVIDKPSWSVKRQVEEAEKFLRLCRANNVPAVVVQNYESMIRPEFAAFATKQKWCATICDESHRIAKPNSQTSKIAAKIGKSSGQRRCLSGTPLGHSPLDIFGQARFLDPRYFGESWGPFRNRYAVTGHFGADHIVAYKNLDELSAIMDSFTYRVTGAVLDLPGETHTDIPCVLDSKSAKVYRELEREMCCDISSGVVTVDNGLVKMLRLQQITSGYLPIPDDPDGRVEDLNNVKARALETLLEGVAQSEPIVVFCRFTEDLRRVEEVAKKLKRRYGELSGKRRDGITANATMNPDIDVIGVQIRSGGAGIDLTRAAIGVYYSIGYSLADFEQSLKRLLRPGQLRPCHYYYLVCSGTADETVYSALERRQDLVEAVLDRLKNIGG